MDNYSPMKILSQKDPQWASEKIGKTNLTIRDFGCTITCVSMLSDYFQKFGGIYRLPWELATFLSFTKNGLLIWSSIKKITGMNFEWRQYGYDEKRILESLKDPKKAVMLEVPLGTGKHWVVALAKFPALAVYWVADPLTGKKRLSSSYGRPTGSAHLNI